MEGGGSRVNGQGWRVKGMMVRVRIRVRVRVGVQVRLGVTM